MTEYNPKMRKKESESDMMSEKYPLVTKSWQNIWENLSGYFNYSFNYSEISSNSPAIIFLS